MRNIARTPKEAKSNPPPKKHFRPAVAISIVGVKVQCMKRFFFCHQELMHFPTKMALEPIANSYIMYLGGMLSYATYPDH
jgi:hypothetical protein